MAAAAAAVPARATAPVRALQSKFVAAGRPADPEAAWRFYRSIGSPRFVVAPMVDHSELAFRMLTRRYKADLCYTPMIHAKQFTMSETFRREIFDTSVGDRPLVAQFCANNPDILLEAARHLEDRCDAVDINLGW
jgi:tRNA-dihydrouridine synthase 1